MSDVRATRRRTLAAFNAGLRVPFGDMRAMRTRHAKVGDMDTDFNAALARLDDEIRDAETRLADLRLKRAGADAFLEYMGSALGSKTSAVPEPAPTTPTVPASDGDHRVAQANPSDAVMEVFRARPLHVLGIDEVYSAVSDAGAGLERAQVRNGIHYAARKGWIDKAGKRGLWILRPENSSAPGRTGAEVDEETISDSSLEMGGTDNGSALLRGGDEPAVRTQDLHSHAGVRASIGGSDSV
jgi:hypothetical protein